ncbi:MAG: hypothetical protein M1826_005931 [Phylliscum demangeonii]|nr:MAG: hypothetical protein M1826_005931 [Phylliscum demangeonii]
MSSSDEPVGRPALLIRELRIISPSAELSRPLVYRNCLATTTVVQLQHLIQESIPTRPPPARQQLVFRGARWTHDTSVPLEEAIGRTWIEENPVVTLHLLLQDPVPAVNSAPDAGPPSVQATLPPPPADRSNLSDAESRAILQRFLDRARPLMNAQTEAELERMISARTAATPSTAADLPLSRSSPADQGPGPVPDAALMSEIAGQPADPAEGRTSFAPAANWADAFPTSVRTYNSEMRDADGGRWQITRTVTRVAIPLAESAPLVQPAWYPELDDDAFSPTVARMTEQAHVERVAAPASVPSFASGSGSHHASHVRHRPHVHGSTADASSRAHDRFDLRHRAAQAYGVEQGLDLPRRRRHATGRSGRTITLHAPRNPPSSSPAQDLSDSPASATPHEASTPEDTRDAGTALPAPVVPTNNTTTTSAAGAALPAMPAVPYLVISPAGPTGPAGFLLVPSNLTTATSRASAASAAAAARFPRERSGGAGSGLGRAVNRRRPVGIDSTDAILFNAGLHVGPVRPAAAAVGTQSAGDGHAAAPGGLHQPRQRPRHPLASEPTGPAEAPDQGPDHVPVAAPPAPAVPEPVAAPRQPNDHQHGQVDNEGRELARVLGGYLWLLVRVLGFVFFFTGGVGGWRRMVILFVTSSIVLLAQTGFFDQLHAVVWDPIRRYLERRLSLAPAAPAAPPPPGPANAARDAHSAPVAAVQAGPDGAAAPLRPASASPSPSPSLLGRIRGHMRVWERALLIFLASLVPGLGEQHIALRRQQLEQRAQQARAVEHAAEAAAAAIVVVNEVVNAAVAATAPPPVATNAENPPVPVGDGATQ